MNIFGAWSTGKACRARMINQNFFECKVKRPNPRFCEYSISMGDGYICNHPTRLVFSSQK